MPRASAREEQYFWNSVALVAFVVLCGVSVWLVATFGTAWPESLGFLDLTVLGLAAFRLIHLLTYDKIFDMVRAAFMDKQGTRLKTAERGWRRAVCELLQCLWCTGVWSALIVVTIYLLGTWGRFAVVVLAVAGLGSLLQIVSRTFAAQA